MNKRPCSHLGILLAILSSLIASPHASGESKAPTPQHQWRLGISGWGFHRFTLFEALEKCQGLGIPYYDGISFQKVSRDIDRPFDANLGAEELEKVKAKVRATGVQIPVLYYAKMPTTDEACQQVFEFGKSMGIQTFISEPAPESLDLLEQYCNEYQINLALHNHGPDQTPHYWHPKKVLEHCKERGPRIGVCPDTGYWMRAGIDPIAGINLLGNRILTIQLHDLNERTPEGHDVPWGTGVGQIAEVLKAIHRLKLAPTLIGLEYSYAFENNLPAMARSARYFKEQQNALFPKAGSSEK